MAFERAQDCLNRLSYLREKDVNSWKASLKITFLVESPEPEVAAMIHLHLICGHISAYTRTQFCPNRFSCLRETGADALRVDGYVTCSVKSPESESPP